MVGGSGVWVAWHFRDAANRLGASRFLNEERHLHYSLGASPTCVHIGLPNNMHSTRSLHNS